MQTTPQDFQLVDQAIASLNAPRDAHIRLQQALARIDADLRALQVHELPVAAGDPPPAPLKMPG